MTEIKDKHLQPSLGWETLLATPKNTSSLVIKFKMIIQVVSAPKRSINRTKTALLRFWKNYWYCGFRKEGVYCVWARNMEYGSRHSHFSLRAHDPRESQCARKKTHQSVPSLFLECYLFFVLVEWRRKCAECISFFVEIMPSVLLRVFKRNINFFFCLQTKICLYKNK